MGQRSVLHGIPRRPVLPMLKTRVKNVVANSLAAKLRQHGFSKPANVYVRSSGDVFHMVDVQYSRWNDAKEVSFTLNCGVYVPGVTSRLGNLPEPKKPKVTDCCITVRVGMLTESRLDVWWKVSAGGGVLEDRQIIEEIGSITENTMMLFFERFKDAKAIACFLAERPSTGDRHIEPRPEGTRLSYAAIIWAKLGASDKCQTCLDQAVQRSRDTPLEDTVASFATRFSCSSPIGGT